MRSSSSACFLSAASKSIGAAAFLAPRPRLAPVDDADVAEEVVEVAEAEEFSRDAPRRDGRDALLDEEDRKEDDVTVRGAVDALVVCGLETGVDRV